MAFLRSLTPSVRRLTLGSTVSSLLPLLAGYVRYCPGGSLNFIAYSPKLVEVWLFRKFADAQECYKGILSLPNVWLKLGVRGGPYEESGRIGVRVAGRRRGVAGQVALPILQRPDGRCNRGGDGGLRRHANGPRALRGVGGVLARPGPG